MLIKVRSKRSNLKVAHLVKIFPMPPTVPSMPTGFKRVLLLPKFGDPSFHESRDGRRIIVYFPPVRVFLSHLPVRGENKYISGNCKYNNIQSVKDVFLGLWIIPPVLTVWLYDCIDCMNNQYPHTTMHIAHVTRYTLMFFRYTDTCGNSLKLCQPACPTT